MIPNPSVHSEWDSWAKSVQQILIPFMANVEATFFRNGETVRLASFQVASLPGPTTPGQVIFCSDESGGATILFSDGTNWRRVQDRAIAS